MHLYIAVLNNYMIFQTGPIYYFVSMFGKEQMHN